MKTERPIFSIIEENIVGGRLPASFALPDDNGSSGSSKLKMAPGAMDGICIYHMPHTALSEDGKEEIARRYRRRSPERKMLMICSKTWAESTGRSALLMKFRIIYGSMPVKSTKGSSCCLPLTN